MGLKIVVHFPSGRTQEIEVESMVLVAFQKVDEDSDPSVDGVSVTTFEFPDATGWGLMESISALGEQMTRLGHSGYTAVGMAVQKTITTGRTVLASMADEIKGPEH